MALLQSFLEKNESISEIICLSLTIAFSIESFLIALKDTHFLRNTELKAILFYLRNLNNLIAVYPIGGWWKTRTNLRKYNNKLRYSLIVSLDTPVENIDMYIDVKNKIETIIRTPIEVEIPINQ